MSMPATAVAGCYLDCLAVKVQGHPGSLSKMLGDHSAPSPEPK